MGFSGLLVTLGRAGWVRWLLLVALVVLYTGWIGYLIASDQPIDFYVYYLAAYGFTRGIDIYSMHNYQDITGGWAALARAAGVEHYTFPYRYPPLTAELVWPLTLLEPNTAALVWLAATAIAFVVSAWLLARLAGATWGMPVALGLLLFFIPTLTTLRAGQVNGFLLLALCVALYFLLRRPVSVGLAVATATMLKLVPLALLGYLFWRRQWRAALAATVGVVILFLAAVPMVGWSGLTSYVRNFASLGVVGSLIPAAPNQSFNGFFARLFIAGTDRWYLLHSPELAQWCYLTASALLVIGTIVLCWPRGDFQRFGELEFALIVAAINLLTPYVWYYQLTLLLIPFFVLLKQAITVGGLRWMVAPLLVGYLAIDIHGVLWHRMSFSPVLSSMPFLTTLLLWGLLARVIWVGKYASQ